MNNVDEKMINILHDYLIKTGLIHPTDRTYNRFDYSVDTPLAMDTFCKEIRKLFDGKE